MQEGQINSSKHWRFGVKNALKTFKESVNAGFAFRYILCVSWVSWFGQLRQFLVVCPTGSFVFFLLLHSHWEPLRGASKCHYLRGSGQGMQQRQAPDLFTGWELQDVLQKFGFQVVAIRRKTMTWNNPRYCRRWGFSMELFELDLPCARIYPSFCFCIT